MADGAGAEVGADTAATTLHVPNGRDDPAQPHTGSPPMAEALNTIRKEWVFHWKLLSDEWTERIIVTVAFGLLALVLGSVSTELWSGGDAKIAGVDGVLAINGFQFFQMLVSSSAGGGLPTKHGCCFLLCGFTPYRCW